MIDECNFILNLKSTQIIFRFLFINCEVLDGGFDTLENPYEFRKKRGGRSKFEVFCGTHFMADVLKKYFNRLKV